MEDFGRPNGDVADPGDIQVFQVRDFQRSPASLDDGEELLSAALTVESIVEQVVSIIASESDFAISNNNNNNNDCEYEKENAEDIIRLMLSGITIPTAISPIKGDELEGKSAKVVNVNLDEKGNYLPTPSVNSSVKSGSPGSSNGNLIDSVSEEACMHMRQDCNGSNVSSGGTTTETDDATNALMMMRILVDENRGLRQEITKLKHVMQLVMSKYRRSMTFLLQELDVYKNDFQKMIKIMEKKAQNFDPKMEILNRNALVEEMKHVMFEAARMDDRTANLFEEKIAQLEYENQGLREITRVALEFGSERLPTYSDKTVQTETSLEQNIDGGDNEKLITESVVKRAESLDVYSASYEIEEDMDSFHTADSLNGSTFSLNQEPDGTSVASPTGEAEEATSPILVVMVGVGDQDKVEFHAEKVDSEVLMEVNSRNDKEKL